jgi:hypothetical protein
MTGRPAAVAWIVLVLFVVSLVYLGLSIVLVLKVQGDIGGNAVGPDDLVVSGPMGVNNFTVYVGKRNLLYATSNWCLNNRCKFRLHSAQCYLHNGIIAIIIAGALSPWV